MLLRWLAVMSGVALGSAAMLVVYGGAMVDAAMGRTRERAARFVMSAPLVVEADSLPPASALAEALWRRGLSRWDDGAPPPGRFSVEGSTVRLGAGLVAGTPGPVRVECGSGRIVPAGGVGLQRAAVAPVPIGTEARDGVVRWWVPLDDLPPYLVTALVDVEDRSFPEHAGVSLRGVGRAALRDLSAGSFVEGGSTITQQLAKNLLLRPRRTVPRKLTETWLAWTLEMRYDKRSILEAYVNRIYLGQDGALQIQGVEAAARRTFGCPVRNLSVAEAALMAGMVAAPNRFDPFAHPAAARARRGVVLQAMADAGHVPAALARELQAAPLPARPTPLRWAPAAQAAESVLTRDRTRAVVPSTIDVDVQAAVSAGVGAALAALEREHPGMRRLAAAGDPVQVGVAVVDGHGAVLAVQGGRSLLPGGFNRATEARRPIGSTVKPLVAAAAMEAGIRADDLFDDSPLEVPLRSGGVWRPRNDDQQFRGPVTLERALVESLNVPMVRIGLAAGMDRVVRVLRGAGLDSGEGEPAVLLGAVEATPLELAAAYASLLDDGLYTTPTFVRDRPGDARRALRPEIAAELLLLLRGVVQRGTAARLAAHTAGELAGKTGTSDGRRDSWFVALRPRCVTVVWMGTDRFRSTGLYGASGAMRVWEEIDRRMPASWSGGSFPRHP